MNLLQERERLRYNHSLKKIISQLQFDKEQVNLKGSYSLKSQLYPADYDLFINIKGNYSNRQIFVYLKDILMRIQDDPNLYFIELKIQQTTGKKVRWYPTQLFKYGDFLKAIKNLDYIKIDLIAYIEFRMIEVSVNYQFNHDSKHTNAVQELKNDMTELIKEGSYYKSLKRLFSINRINENMKMIKKLTEFFNSKYGKNYSIVANLEAIKKLAEYYKDPTTNKKININLKDLKIDRKDIPSTIKALESEYNKVARQILS